MEPALSEPLARMVVPAASEAAEPPEEPAWGVVGIPRAAGETVETGIGNPRRAKLGACRARMHDGARSFQTRHMRVGEAALMVLIDERTLGCSLALDIGIVLDGNRNSLQTARGRWSPWRSDARL